MKIKTLALALLAFALASVANAIPVTVNSVEYDITTITTTFSNESTLLMSQPWWDDSDLAHDVSAALGDDLGAPTTFPFGPFFAYSLTGPFGSAAAYPLGSGVSIVYYPDTPSTFAIVESVASVPDRASTLMLTAGGLLAAHFVRGRRKRAVGIR